MRSCCERVAVAQGHRAVLDALVVDRQAEGRADLIVSAVALADRAALVVLGLRQHAHGFVDLARELRLAVLADQRQHRRLDRRQAGVQAQHRPLLALDLLLVIRVHEKRERRPIRARGRLDHVRHVALAAGLVEVLELLPGELRVLGQVEVAAVGDPLELRPADREQVLDIARARGVVRELVLHRGRADADDRDAGPAPDTSARALRASARTTSARRPGARRTPSPSARTRGCGR